MTLGVHERDFASHIRAYRAHLKNGNGNQRHDPSTADVELGRAGIMPPLVPDGEYAAIFLRAEKGRFESLERWFLWFRIVTPGEMFGMEVYLSCPCPPKGRAFGLGSKLVAACAVATGAMPRRRDRLSTTVFRQKTFRLRTRTVRNDGTGALRSEEDHYSVVDRLLSVETGGPQP